MASSPRDDLQLDPASGRWACSCPPLNMFITRRLAALLVRTRHRRSCSWSVDDKCARSQKTSVAVLAASLSSSLVAVRCHVPPISGGLASSCFVEAVEQVRRCRDSICDQQIALVGRPMRREFGVRIHLGAGAIDVGSFGKNGIVVRNTCIFSSGQHRARVVWASAGKSLGWGCFLHSGCDRITPDLYCHYDYRALKLWFF